MELPNNPRSRSLASTPASSPGLFRPSPPPTRTNTICLSDGTLAQSPYLHPLQMHKVKETHKAQVEQDFITGRKLINQYEIIDEIGRGVHGKVKRARSLETNEFVAIKIIQRFSKKRRLGKVTATPEDKTKREIAILKKIRHANVVGLIEVIDDPEFKKIYMVLEHVELGEILWRKKGTPQICLYERRRVEREMRGEADTGDDERFFRMMERRRLRKEAHRARASTIAMDNPEYWSLEHGDDTEDEVGSLSRHSTHESNSYLGHQHGSHLSMARSDQGAASASRGTSRAPSRTSSKGNGLGSEWEIGPGDSDDEEDPANMTRRASLASLPLSHSTHSSGHGFESHFLGMQNYEERQSFRGRSPSMADSIISHMSSVDDVAQHDIYEEDFSYVPCLTLEQARTTFRDVVLGLEYLHFEGIVHRDIKPANLLWTKEHHVKISDFGVSYFGRPVRAGEAEENVSEADATDFDDDLELAKTVGTPAFFAPELCYTDLDAEQPKVGKEIDIWSLGVTLYCLVFARIPFLAEDEYQLFRTIAQQDVYIPKQRLKPVNPSRTNSRLDLRSSGASKDGYRDDAELALEDVDDELRDLIAGMLRKDPKRRISLRQVKWHPWTVKDITNVVGWIDDTDPGRVNAGGKIEVDDSDLDRAVVPLTFLERARSAVKKAVGKVIGRSEGSRRRAVSNATSSGGDFSHLHSPVTPGREGRRASLRGDESYFAPVREAREHVDHPLAQSVTASPVANPNETFGVQLKKEHSSSDGDLKRRERPGPPDRTVSTAASIQTVIHRGHSHSKSVSGSSPPLQASSEADEYSPPPFAVFTDHKGNPFSEPSIKISRGPSSPGAVRTRSVERPLFVSSDKHGKPSIALSGALAPGSMDQPDANLDEALRSSVSSPLATDPPQLMPSPYFRRPSLAAQQSLSSPNVSDRIAASLGHYPRSSTTSHTPEGKTPVERNWPQSTQESFAKAQAILVRRRHQEAILEMKRKQDAALAREANRSQPSSSCPPSPDDDDLIKQQEIEANRKKSSSTVDSYDQTSPITSPSDMISPLSITNLDASQNQSFASHPSLPTLVSGASSVSADAEGDFLSHPGTVKTMETISSGTPDTMTPPALSKESTIDETASPRKTDLADPDDEEGYNADRDRALVTEDDDSDDSDEGLTMGRRSKPLKKTSGARRDTNISICSTETAKKVSMNE